MDTRRGSSRLRLLIAEDQYLTREGTRRLLEEPAELEVVGVAFELDSVLVQARRLGPDVVLMDIRMPRDYAMEGIDAAHAIREERRETGVVMLTQRVSGASRRAKHRVNAANNRFRGNVCARNN